MQLQKSHQEDSLSLNFQSRSQASYRQFFDLEYSLNNEFQGQNYQDRVFLPYDTCLYDQVLDLNHGNSQIQPQGQFEDNSTHHRETQFEFEKIQFNAHRMPQNQIPIVSQQQSQSISPKEANPFNNMPGFSIGAIQELIEKIKQFQFLAQDLETMQAVTSCYQDLRDKIFMKLSSKNGNRTHLRMVFNNVDKTLNSEILKKAKLSKPENKYLELLNKYGEQILNQAKDHLRKAVYESMGLKWMHEHSQKRQFNNQIEEKKEIFQKYLRHLRSSLYEGEIKSAVKRNQVLQISLFNIEE